MSKEEHLLYLFHRKKEMKYDQTKSYSNKQMEMMIFSSYFSIVKQLVDI